MVNKVGLGGRTACVKASDVPMSRRAALVRMLPAGKQTLGGGSHCEGLAFFKKPREDAAVSPRPQICHHMLAGRL